MFAAGAARAIHIRVMISFLGEILLFPVLTAELATAALGFSVDAFRRAATSAEAQSAALLIAFLAGVSEMLGQSVILVVNRVALYRFVASLVFTGATYVATALTWAASALALAPLTPAGGLSPAEAAGVLGVVSLAFAPRLLGALSIAPYFGIAFGHVLEVWAMLLAIYGLHVAIDLPIGASVACGGAGWLISYGFRSFLGRALAKPLGRLKLAVVGSTLDKSPQKIIDDLAIAIRERAEKVRNQEADRR